MLVRTSHFWSDSGATCDVVDTYQQGQRTKIYERKESIVKAERESKLSRSRRVAKPVAVLRRPGAPAEQHVRLKLHIVSSSTMLLTFPLHGLRGICTYE